MARRFQFTIRLLLILTLLLSLPLGWMAFRRAQRERRWKRIFAIQKLGGEVDLNFARQGEQVKGDGADDSPPWYIIAVRLPKSRVTDAELVFIESISTLKRLDLSATRVSDAGLARLERLHQLEQLDLRGTRTTETGVSRLQRLLPKCKVVR
jgi:hypothetical protein